MTSLVNNHLHALYQDEKPNSFSWAIIYILQPEIQCSIFWVIFFIFFVNSNAKNKQGKWRKQIKCHTAYAILIRGLSLRTPGHRHGASAAKTTKGNKEATLLHLRTPLIRPPSGYSACPWVSGTAYFRCKGCCLPFEELKKKKKEICMKSPQQNGSLNCKKRKMQELWLVWLGRSSGGPPTRPFSLHKDSLPQCYKPMIKFTQVPFKKK